MAEQEKNRMGLSRKIKKIFNNLNENHGGVSTTFVKKLFFLFLQSMLLRRT